MALARIKWLSKDCGGKDYIPDTNINFYTMIKHENYEKSFNWSMVFVNKEIITKFETITQIMFLMENAPWEILTIDSKFTIYSGYQKLGEGIIISSDKEEVNLFSK